MAVERPFGVDHCVRQDGTTNSGLRSAFTASVGIANAWSVGVWYKPDANAFVTPFGRIWTIRDADGEDLMEFTLEGTVANNPISMNMFDTASAQFKLYRWESLAVVDVWNFFMVTWDGTDLLLYKDGTLRTPSIKAVDNPGTMADSGRRIGFGVRSNSGAEQASGSLYAMGVWSSILTSGEQLTLAKGVGHRTIDEILTDWRTDHGAYLSSANLQHYYRPGFAANIGTDYGVAASLMPLVAEGPARPLIVKDAPVTDKSYGPEFSLLQPTGSDEVELFSSSIKIGISSTWTLGVWYKPNSAADSRPNQLIRLHGGPNDIRVLFRPDNPGNPIQLVSSDSANVSYKGFLWANDPLKFNAWNFIAVTLDAANEVDLYSNGVLRVKTATFFDTGSSQEDTTRIVSLGATAGTGGSNIMAGRIYAAGIWSSALTSAEQLSLYNFGDGQDAPFDTDLAAYVSSANLQHWYRPGRHGSIGFDQGVAVSGVITLAVGGTAPSNRIISRDAPVGPP